MALILAALVGCLAYRTYPLVTMDPPGPGAFEPSGVAVLEDGRMVVSAEGEARVLYVPDPDRPLVPGTVLGAFPLRDLGRRGAIPGWRAGVRLAPRPIRWLARGRREVIPYDIEDLASFGPDRVLGITAYDTIGRRTGHQKDYVARPRVVTEQIFVLERAREGDAEVWQERAVPEIERLRGVLSDWGRAQCQDDMLVQGIAADADSSTIWIGLRRCDGPVARVLRFDLDRARDGAVADLVVVADGVRGGRGPTEGVSGLTWAAGHLLATTAWDSYGLPGEPTWGGRLSVVRDGVLVPLPAADRFVDRPSGVAVLEAPVATDTALLDSVVIFDNDDASQNAGRPNLTLLEAFTVRPQGGRWAELVDLAEAPDVPPVGLNGFDVRWYVRDHRLSMLGVRLDREPADQTGPGESGAWTRALGGLWQLRVGGSLGVLARGVPLVDKRTGHNRQAAAWTDYTGSNLSFTGYRATVSTVPRDRERHDPSVAGLLHAAREASRVRITLPRAAMPGAGLVLQGFEIDTSSRADRGVCLAALDVGVDWAGDSRREVDVQATLVGGLCNDFDLRGPAFHHGLTTAVDGGVRVIVHFAVVEGAEAHSWRASVWDRTVPGPRDGAPIGMRDEEARNHVHCVGVAPDGAVTRLARPVERPPSAWVQLGSTATPVPRGPASLRGFTLALDPLGFDEATTRRRLTEEEALDRNNYIYRYLVRAFPTADGAFVEGGLTHGIHPAGPLRDNARPSALLVDARMTTFPSSVAAPAFDTVWPRRADDPNLEPEDGYIRWATGRRLDDSPACSPPW